MPCKVKCKLFATVSDQQFFQGVSMIQHKPLKAMAWLLAATLGMAAHAQLPDVQQHGAIQYITGGFGLDESTAIKDAMPDFPLVLTFASSDGGRGAYVSNVQVVIRDDQDATVLNVESRGPYLLARLPAGTYRVFATYRNRTQDRSVKVTEGESTRAVFDWPRDTGRAGPADESTASGASAPADADTAPSGRQFAPGSTPGVD